jgi:hypothetical protein
MLGMKIPIKNNVPSGSDVPSLARNKETPETTVNATETIQ